MFFNDCGIFMYLQFLSPSFFWYKTTIKNYQDFQVQMTSEKRCFACFSSNTVIKLLIEENYLEQPLTTNPNKDFYTNEFPHNFLIFFLKNNLTEETDLILSFFLILQLLLHLVLAILHKRNASTVISSFCWQSMYNVWHLVQHSLIFFVLPILWWRVLEHVAKVNSAIKTNNITRRKL